MNGKAPRPSLRLPSIRTKREVVSESPLVPESQLQAIDNSVKETEQTFVAPPMAGRRKPELLKEETVHTLFSI